VCKIQCGASIFVVIVLRTAVARRRWAWLFFLLIFADDASVLCL